MRGLAPIVGLLSVAVAGAALAQAPRPGPGARTDTWGRWRFLVGDWVGGGSGDPGEGSGFFSFRFELDGKVLVRRNHSEYPAAPGRPASVHDDLMVIYADAARGGFAAVYFDNEGHVIRYVAELAADGTRITFLNEAAPSTPGFRLIYTKLPGDAVGISFEVAPPGGPGVFKTYLTGKAVRRAGR
jgi:catechol 2,3-dioxygenase-like lactoylglutathione lyase family enzyme